MNTTKKRILNKISIYVQEHIKFDFVAGLTVALIAIPQAMAYATIAGVNPIYGLYAAILPAIIGSLFGSSDKLITGPTNATALVTASILVVYADHDNYVEFVFMLAVISGIIKLLLGLFGLGNIIRYVSNSVLTGLLSGAGALIIINQLGSVLGIERIQGGAAYTQLFHIFTNLPKTNVYVLIIGLLTISILLIGKVINRKIPSALIGVVITTVFVKLAGWHIYGVKLIGDINNFSSIDLSFHIPNISRLEFPVFITSAMALALFSLVEAGAISKAIGLTTGQKVNPSKEFIGQGVASIVGGFFQCIPPSGSPSRSAVNLSSGARTKLAGVFSGIFVFISILIIKDMIKYMPIASLSAIVIISAISLFNKEHIILTWKSRVVSRVVMLATFLSTLLIPLQYAIYLGIILSVIIYLAETSHIDITYLTVNQKGDFIEHELEDIFKIKPNIAIINIEGALYFGAVSDLEEKLEKVFNAGVKVVILRLRRMKHMASTGVSSLEVLASKANQLGINLIFCGINEEIEATLTTSGLSTKIGSHMTFKATHILFESTTEAIKKAEEICCLNEKP